MKTLLTARDVSTGYPGRTIVRNASFSVSAGELWAVVGPNGAGKSTLLRALLGLLPLSGGEVDIEGRPLRDYRRDELARCIAWVSQQPEAGHDFTALEVVLMGRAPHIGRWGLTTQEDVAKAHAALRSLGLEALAPRPCHELSGGELRLVGLARALVQEPRLLLLDEPTAFLDLKHQLVALEQLRRCTREGMGAIAVLHDVNLAAAFADQVLLLKSGEVLASGPSRDVLNREALEALFGVPLEETTLRGQRLFAPRA